MGAGWAGFPQADSANAVDASYKVLGWNDLGMHCYNKDFRDMAVLPPFNNLWVQVVKKGDPPQLVSEGITVSYSFQDNTYSAGKTNFWAYDKLLFGVNLPTNIGLTGNGLTGKMVWRCDHFEASGIPLTEFNDATPKTSNPYQFADIVVKDSAGVVLATQTVVAPVSSEMRCNNCHKDGGSANPDIRTGRVATNILTLHDQSGITRLMSMRPVLCARCHGSNALGTPGQNGVRNLSNVMHSKHAEIVPNTLNGCYNCHPGPQTRCLRDVMFTEKGMTCVSCHGGMQKVSTNTNPWLKEPRCNTCHEDVRQYKALYRLSKGHGDLYCSACHDSPHAIAPSNNPKDGIKFTKLQGEDGPLKKCSTCHTTRKDGEIQH